MMTKDYYSLTAEELGQDAKIPVAKLGETGEVFYEIAEEMLSCIEACRAAGKPCVMIVPVGPVGQYPIFARLVNERNVSLKHVWFINMDEYLTADDHWIPAEDRLSFRGFMERTVYTKIRPELVMPAEQRVFPDPLDPAKVTRLVEEMGVDLCVGGIGITGHVAFNEPENVTPEEYLGRTTRVLSIAPETLTTNAIGDLCGALERMPRRAVTIGFKEIFSAKRVRLYVFRDWHRAVIRRACYGEASAAFPVSLLQAHPDCRITCNENAAQPAIPEV